MIISIYVLTSTSWLFLDVVLSLLMDNSLYEKHLPGFVVVVLSETGYLFGRIQLPCFLAFGNWLLWTLKTDASFHTVSERCPLNLTRV